MPTGEADHHTVRRLPHTQNQTDIFLEKGSWSIGLSFSTVSLSELWRFQQRFPDPVVAISGCLASFSGHGSAGTVLCGVQAK